MADNETSKLDTEIAAKEAELAKLEKATAHAQDFLDRVKIDGARFVEIHNEIASYRQRLVKVCDLDALEEKITELETRLTAVESKIDTPEP